MLMSAKESSADEQPNWAYTPEDGATTENRTAGRAKESRSINWTASEFVDIHRSTGWHALFLIGFLLLSIVVFIFTKDYISSVLIAAAGIIFIIASSRKPRQLAYEINEDGIKVGARFYVYGVFKSFDLIQEGGIKSISLMPLKRFMPEISIYFPPEQEEDIVEVISGHLPHDEHMEKSIDKLARKLRF
jgi:hypothetical protein